MFRNNAFARKPSKGRPLQVSLLLIGFAAIHSLFASRFAKETVESVAGTRVRNGFYRVGFNLQSVVSTVWLIKNFTRLPDRDLYNVPSPGSWLLRGIQVASLALLGSAIFTVNLRHITGLAQLAAFLRGEMPGPEPEAQGPRLSANDQIDNRGPFRYIRHPDNLPIITLLWSFPRMTVNRLTLALLSSVYAVLGSWHEDSRMRAQYGEPFDRYARKVPMMVPRSSKTLRRGDAEEYRREKVTILWRQRGVRSSLGHHPRLYPCLFLGFSLFPLRLRVSAV